MSERLQIRGRWPRCFTSGRASRYYNGFLAFVGFLLSPLSWWNDLIVNIPLAYLLASPIAWLWPSSYVPAFVAAYWLTNLLGLLMMDFGIRGLFGGRAQAGSRSRVLAYSLLYTLLILVLVVLGYLPAPLPAPALP